MAKEKEYDILAILGLIFAVVTPIVGVILSAISLYNFSKGSKKKGRELAIAGLIIGLIFIIIGVLFFVGMMSMMFIPIFMHA